MMDDKRKYRRFPILLTANYLEEDKGDWHECSVTNVSREGMGVGIYSRERIAIGSVLQLEIAVPIQKELISAMGTLMWIKKLNGNPRFNFVGGLMLIRMAPEDRWTLLDHVYEEWCKQVND
jgi:hypothetical protein